MNRRKWITSASLGAVSVSALQPQVLQAQAGAAPLPSSGSPKTSTAKPAGPGQLLSVTDRRKGYHENLSFRGEALSAQQFRNITTRRQWEVARPRILESLRWELGLPDPNSKSDLRASVTGHFARTGYSVENIVFQSLPGFYVTGNLYLPVGSDKRAVPAVVYVCGHSPSPLGAKTSYQHHAIWFARHGMAAFVLDTIEFAEIAAAHHGTHNLELWNWLSLGYNPAGPEVWNAIRALDYLETRPEIDSKRVAITGRSGGGAVSWFTAAVDDRFQVASPVHGTWTVGPHIRNNTVRENCDCIYVWNSDLLDLTTIGALIAPRPLLIVNGLRDDCFPPSGYRPVEKQLRQVYSWYAAPEKIDTFEDNTNHEDTFAYRKAANLWVTRWLNGQQPDYTEEGIAPESDPTVLRVLNQRPSDAINEGIDRLFIPLPQTKKPSEASAWQSRREELLGILNNRLLRGLGPRDADPRLIRTPLRTWVDRYADAWNIQFQTEEHMHVTGQLYLPKVGQPVEGAVLYIKGGEDLVYGIDYDDILSILPTHAILVLRPRTVDYRMTSPELAETKMSAALLGTTLETLQLHDVLKGIDVLLQSGKERTSSGKPKLGLSVYGRRAMAMLAIYAGAIDNRIGQVIADRPPESHWDGPAIMHALRYTDLPEVAALIAPRKLAFLGRIPSAYQQTASLASLTVGAEGARPTGDRVVDAVSLGDAVRKHG